MRSAFVLAGIAATLALVGCAEEEKFSEKKVFAATKVEDGEVGGDPFCAVDSVLPSADAITKERDAKSAAAIITSKSGNVGVVVKPPFPDDCEETVLKGLNELDPVEEKEKN